MSVNGVSNAHTYGATAYEQSKNASKAQAKEATKETKESNSSGVVYNSTMTESDRAALVEKLKADNQSQIDSFKSMVQGMLSKQGFAAKNSDDMWKMLASGNFKVDAATAQAAKDAISEDGYWGVNQTSDRIFEMAKALTGGDSSKMDKMLEAFEKGFKQATKAWGRSLPDISKQTADAVKQKFADYKTANTSSVEA